MTWSITAGSQVGSESAVERALSPETSHSKSSNGINGEYSTIFNFYTLINMLPVPTAGYKHKPNNSPCMGDNNCQVKQQRTIIPVAMAEGSIPLKKTWEMSALSDQKVL